MTLSRVRLSSPFSRLCCAPEQLHRSGEVLIFGGEPSRESSLPLHLTKYALMPTILLVSMPHASLGPFLPRPQGLHSCHGFFQRELKCAGDAYSDGMLVVEDSAVSVEEARNTTLHGCGPRAGLGIMQARLCHLCQGQQLREPSGTRGFTHHCPTFHAHGRGGGGSWRLFCNVLASAGRGAQAQADISKPCIQNSCARCSVLRHAGCTKRACRGRRAHERDRNRGSRGRMHKGTDRFKAEEAARIH
jgi:hypothetical protein